MENLYNLPNLYDVFYDEQNETPLKEHYKEVFRNKSIHSIHDCSIGTGNLTFALYDMGYQISGSDISPIMLEKAKEKSQKRKIDVTLYQSDFRFLEKEIQNTYDCLISTGNSLPHVNNDGVKQALKSMSKLVRNNGYIYLDIRNWDNIIRDRERFFLYNPKIIGDERINVIQVWDYLDDGKVRFNILYTFEKNNRIVSKEECVVDYYPILKDVLIEELDKLGFGEFEIFNFIYHNIKSFHDMKWYTLICKKIR